MRFACWAAASITASFLIYALVSLISESYAAGYLAGTFYGSLHVAAFTKKTEAE